MTGPTFAPPAPPPSPKPPAQRPPAKPAAKPEPEAGGLKLFTYLRLHWLMILFCGTLLGGTAAYAAWELLASKYESYALLQVSSVPFSIGSNNPNQARTDFATYMKTTAGQVKYEFVLNAALNDIKDLPTIKAQKEPIKFLEEELMVSASDGSEIIRITMKGHNATDVQKIVNAVQAAFLKEVIQTEVREKKDRLAKIEVEQADLLRILEDRSPEAVAKRRALQQAGGVPDTAPPTPAAGAQPPAPLPPIVNAGPLVVPPKPAAAVGETAFERLLKFEPKFVSTQLMALYAEAQRLPGQIREVEYQISLLNADAKRLENAPADPTTAAVVDAHPDVKSAYRFAEGLRREYEGWANAAKPADRNASGLRSMYKQWQEAAATYESLRQEKAHAIEAARLKPLLEKLTAELTAAHRNLQKLKDQQAVVKAQIEGAEATLMKLPVPEPIEKAGYFRRDANGKEVPYDPTKTDLSAVDHVFAGLVNQATLMRLELKSPERVRERQKASAPMQKDLKKQIIGTVFAGLMGYGLIAIGVIGYETMARRVSSLVDVKGAGPAAVVGVIPCQPGAALGRDPVKRAAANEAIDKLRAYVSQAWLSRGATAVAVTSPVGDEGKAFTAFGLASSLAQAGYKTLLADFDLRDPALHAFAGVPNVNGVCELLRGETDAAGSIQFLPSGLHMVPAGKWSDEARKAATGDRLETLLARLKEPYDVVVVNGHAILTAAESVEVARRCEVVLVCAKYRETTTPLLRRATDRVAALEIPYSGVVYVGATDQEALC